MSNFTPLYGSILTSTIWAEDAETRLVWITMLAMADASGYVGASIPGLAHAARVSTDGCRAAINKFLSPDPDSRTKENEGKRIVESDGGWTLLNYSRHRERATEIRHNALSAIRMRDLRAKRKAEENVANVPEQGKQLQNVTEVPQARERQERGIGNSSPSLMGEKKLIEEINAWSAGDGGRQFDESDPLLKTLLPTDRALQAVQFCRENGKDFKSLKYAVAMVRGIIDGNEDKKAKGSGKPKSRGNGWVPRDITKPGSPIIGATP